MMQYLYDNNIILYTYAGLCGLGLLIRFIVNMVYKSLVKESDRLGETKNKKLKHIKMKFESFYKLKIGVNNVDTFVDKSVLKYRFCGPLLSTWDNLCGQILFLNLLIVPVIAVFGVVYDCGQDQIIFAGAVGISSSAILILVDKSINLSGKRKLMRLNLLDYLENICKARMEQEWVDPELTSQLRRELLQVAESNKQISSAGPEAEKTVEKDELNRRREARVKKEEEKKALAVKREEEQKRAEEARKDEERRRKEERKLAAARRREEERLKLEQERDALEARKGELKQKALEKQQALELKRKMGTENEQMIHNEQEELQNSPEKTDMDQLVEGLGEIAAEKEQKEKISMDKQESKTAAFKMKPRTMSYQEEKLIEDVLKEFFA